MLRRPALIALTALTLPSLACPSTPGDESGEGNDEVAATTDDTDTTGDTGMDTGTDTDTGVPPEPATLTIMEEVVFYDGYAATVDEPVPEGVVRHSNSLLATKLSDEQLDQIQTTIKLGVIVGALCDNYDRIGSVHLALVPKGQDSYVPADVDRLEIARFITPFMNMNKDPKSVPYQWQADELATILRNETLRAEYDFWMELSIFGVPYAANTEVPGCEGRNDTQLGTLLIYTDSSAPAQPYNWLLPVAIKEPFNNYQEGASDMLGTTRKTINFDLPSDAELIQLVVITSNHGANQGGEEYIRRNHYAYVDGNLAMQYKPGRDSCEPFRMYNTQGNGIYGPSPRSDEEWQSFSNWCPGDIIDTRTVSWGPFPAGTHEFVIEVPDATFNGGQGDFPFSLYIMAEL